ncbi:hypothetical protein CJU94_00085 [Paraburkholderia aromaticivorans]|uniref:Uncharacterized protein n=1 Tax=Paraburkholderia aromaticivorans TaxID=2026199 RepID=A0A248VCD0_9BURK|nr:hypothetical protein CJU94_00085 [Paraburkholderia aromaticivorans]
MLSGQRESERQILPRAVSAKLLGHSSAGTTASYVNFRRCLVGSPPASCFEIPGVKAVADSERAPAEITSPFTRVHEEMNRAEALFAHHGALRAQLEDE